MAWISYDGEMNYEKGTEGLAIYLPTEQGYINYNFVHTVFEERNADIWRLSVTNLCDSQRKYVKQITKTGAEWEMAVKILGRPDFIGGYAHGDEKFTSLTAMIDGEEIEDITKLNQKQFTNMSIIVCSIGYDPNDGITKALEHRKEFLITDDGITLHQTITWCRDYILDDRLGSYLAMMPPMKHAKNDAAEIITDSYYTDVKAEPINIESSGCSIKGHDVSSMTVFGKESRLYFTMTKSNYSPLYKHGNTMIITDNGAKNNYNKMYFVFAQDEKVVSGDVWRATTTYQIDTINSSISAMF